MLVYIVVSLGFRPIIHYLYYTHYSAYIKAVPCTILLTNILYRVVLLIVSLFSLSLSLLILNNYDLPLVTQDKRTKNKKPLLELKYPPEYI
jgi:hypothetical protein